MRFWAHEIRGACQKNYGYCVHYNLSIERLSRTSSKLAVEEYISHPQLKVEVKTGLVGMLVESRNRLADFLYFLRHW